MRAAVCERYGPPEVVTVRDVEMPRPKDDEVLVKIRATTVNSGDARLRAARVPRGLGLMVRVSMGFVGPRQPVLGLDFAGEIAEVGPAVTRYRPGDQVVGSAGFALGCHAEYRTLNQDGAIVAKPPDLSYEEAVSLCFGGATALDFFKRGNLRHGEKVLINGASGAVGVMAVQIAKQIGAEVTGVCGPSNVDLVRSLGADHVVDYSKEDFAKRGETYDVVMDNVGNAPFSRVRGLLGPGGRFLMVVGDLGQMVHARFEKRVIGGTAGDDAEVLAHLMHLAASGALRPVVDRTYPLDQIVAAHRHVDSGHKKGSVVVTVAHGG